MLHLLEFNSDLARLKGDFVKVVSIAKPLGLMEHLLSTVLGGTCVILLVVLLLLFTILLDNLYLPLDPSEEPQVSLSFHP